MVLSGKVISWSMQCAGLHLLHCQTACRPELGGCCRRVKFKAWALYSKTFSGKNNHSGLSEIQDLAGKEEQ